MIIQIFAIIIPKVYLLNLLYFLCFNGSLILVSFYNLFIGIISSFKLVSKKFSGVICKFPFGILFFKFQELILNIIVICFHVLAHFVHLSSSSYLLRVNLTEHGFIDWTWPPLSFIGMVLIRRPLIYKISKRSSINLNNLHKFKQWLMNFEQIKKRLEVTSLKYWLQRLRKM